MNKKDLNNTYNEIKTNKRAHKHVKKSKDKLGAAAHRLNKSKSKTNTIMSKKFYKEVNEGINQLNLAKKEIKNPTHKRRKKQAVVFGTLLLLLTLGYLKTSGKGCTYCPCKGKCKKSNSQLNDVL